MPHIDIRLEWQLLPETDDEQLPGRRVIPLYLRALHKDSSVVAERRTELDPVLAALYPGGIEAMALDDMVATQCDTVAGLLRFLRDKSVI